MALKLVNLPIHCVTLVLETFSASIGLVRCTSCVLVTWLLGLIVISMLRGWFEQFAEFVSLYAELTWFSALLFVCVI